MFTGIIENIGKIESLRRFTDRLELTVGCNFANELEDGDNVSVNGACLTVKGKHGTSFISDVVSETLSRSSLNHSKVGEYVNLERALPVNGRFEGHIVQGHVDTKSIITNIIGMGASREIEIRVPEKYGKYLTEKGSVAVDGVSLTIAALYDGYFKIAIIPYTALKTNLFHKKIGDYVNLEFDVLAKYLESLFAKAHGNELSALKDTRIDMEFLKKAGFLN